MLWPNLNFHIYINYKRGREGREGKGRGVVRAMGKGKHKGASIGECSMFRKDFVLGLTYLQFSVIKWAKQCPSQSPIDVKSDEAIQI
jgi:hypothetical protein